MSGETEVPDTGTVLPKTPRRVGIAAGHGGFELKEQAKAEQVVYIDNTPMFVEIAESLGIRSIHHMNYKSTCEQLASFGLSKEPGVSHATS
jgi:hypothetical protein